MSTVSNYLLNSPATNPLCNSFMPVDTDRAEESKVFAENKEDRSPAGYWFKIVQKSFNFAAFLLGKRCGNA